MKDELKESIQFYGTITAIWLIWNLLLYFLIIPVVFNLTIKKSIKAGTKKGFEAPMEESIRQSLIIYSDEMLLSADKSEELLTFEDQKATRGCNHDKVYSNYVLTSYPAQYPWICRKCGHKGTDTGVYSSSNEYDEIVKKFNKKETEKQGD